MLINAILVLGGVGLVFSLGLGIASIIFAREENPFKIKILNILPGANCGACGFAGCEAYAEALVQTDIPLDKCTAGGPEATIKIGGILNKDVDISEQKVAVLLCSGGENCEDRFTYQGVETCQAAYSIFGGQKACQYGCLGLDDCIRACPFDAIEHISGRVPIIDPDRCRGCGLCVSACPKKVIELVPVKFSVHIRCKSLDKGVLVRKVCKTGCIACGVCVKICPVKDIVLENNLARMKYNLCDNCGLCMEKCPTKTIEHILPNVTKSVVADSSAK